MKIFVSVKTHSKKEGIKKVDTASFEVRVRSLPVEGKANQAVIETLAEYFDVPRSRVRILKGERSKLKTVEIG